jgi:predicted helicase
LGNGIVTKRDRLCVQRTVGEVWQSMLAFRDEREAAVRVRYHIPDDVRDWRYEWAKADVLANFDESNIKKISYRPFDSRFMLYTGNARGFVGWPVKQVMANYLRGPNIGLLSSKANRDAEFAHAFVTDCPSEAIFLSATTGSNAMNMPLYLYPDEETTQSDAFAPKHRVLNLNPKAYLAICKAAGIDPADQAGTDENFRAAAGDARRSEVKIFDYVYSVLHSPNYREAFAAFLKADYARIPYPPSPDVFRRLSEQGERLRRLHLMEPQAIGDATFPYIGDGDDVVAAGYPKIEGERIQINSNQYFDGVPPAAWMLRIGGYQPAQKWLKDRRGLALTWDDITHYQKIIAILAATHRIKLSIELNM